jgi:hypothetical protein
MRTMLSTQGPGLAGWPTREHVDVIGDGREVEHGDVDLLDPWPFRDRDHAAILIFTDGVAGVLVPLENGFVSEAGEGNADPKATRAREELDRSQHALTSEEAVETFLEDGRVSNLTFPYHESPPA